MKRKEFIRRIRNVYLQVCILKILKPAFGGELPYPKLIFRDKPKYESLGEQWFMNYIYINISRIKFIEQDIDVSLVIAAFTIIHECCHIIQAIDEHRYCTDIEYKRFIEEECNYTAQNIYMENIETINNITKIRVESVGNVKLKDKFTDIRETDIERNQVIHCLSRFLCERHIDYILNSESTNMIIKCKKSYIEYNLITNWHLNRVVIYYLNELFQKYIGIRFIFNKERNNIDILLEPYGIEKVDKFGRR